MAELNKTDLKAIFKAGAKPTEAQFASLIESQVNLVETQSNDSTSRVAPASNFINLGNSTSADAFYGLVGDGANSSYHVGSAANPDSSSYIRNVNGFHILMNSSQATASGYGTAPVFSIQTDTGIPNASPSHTLFKINRYKAETGSHDTTIEFTGNITASNDISASGTLTAGALTVSGTTTFSSAQVGQRLTIKNLTATDETLTSAESGKLCVFSDADGATVTLPDSGDGSLIGVYYDFYVATAATSNYHIVACADTTNEDIEGFLHTVDFDTNPSQGDSVWRALNSDGYNGIKMDGTTYGGVVGTTFRIMNIAADRWSITGTIIHTGTPGTPFVSS